MTGATWVFLKERREVGLDTYRAIALASKSQPPVLISREHCRREGHSATPSMPLSLQDRDESGETGTKGDVSVWLGGSATPALHAESLAPDASVKLALRRLVRGPP